MINEIIFQDVIVGTFDDVLKFDYYVRKLESLYLETKNGIIEILIVERGNLYKYPDGIYRIEKLRFREVYD